MDIRIINSKREIINVSNLSIKRVNNCLVGINERNEVVLIDEFGSVEEAEKRLYLIGEIIIAADKEKSDVVLVDNIEGEEENGESK